jgi:hypothetical protein
VKLVWDETFMAAFWIPAAQRSVTSWAYTHQSQTADTPELHVPHPLTVLHPSPLAAEPLPALRDVPSTEKQALFVRKLHLCAFSFDFTDPAAHVREKEVKRQTLLELVDYVNSGSGKFTEAVRRALPPAQASGAAVLAHDLAGVAQPRSWPAAVLVVSTYIRNA